VKAIQQLSDEEMRRRIKFTPDFKFVYSNHSRIASSFYDIRIFLGQSNITPVSEVTVEEEVCAIMSPEAAKAFAENLMGTILQYERSFGTLRNMADLKPSATK